MIFARARARQAIRALRHNARLLRNGLGDRPRIYLSASAAADHAIWRSYHVAPPTRYVSYPLAEAGHWFNGAPRLLRKPFVIEVEHVLAMSRDISNWQLGLRSLDRINREIASDACRAVLNVSRGAIEHGKRFVRPELWEKFEVLHPAFPAREPSPAQDRPFTIGTIASRWSDKGVPEVLDAFAALRERFRKDVRLTIVVSKVPGGVTFGEGVTVHEVGRMDAALKERIYRSIDLLLVPCYSDTGALYGEACSYGVPVIATRIHHGDDFVRHGRTGYLFDPPMFSYSEGYGTRWKTWEEFLAAIEQARIRGELQCVTDAMIAGATRLMLDRNSYARMSDEARRFHRECFSYDGRNEKLRRLYRRIAG